jgi:hypothetical protein
MIMLAAYSLVPRVAVTVAPRALVASGVVRRLLSTKVRIWCVVETAC